MQSDLSENAQNLTCSVSTSSWKPATGARVEWSNRTGAILPAAHLELLFSAALGLTGDFSGSCLDDMEL